MSQHLIPKKPTGRPNGGTTPDIGALVEALREANLAYDARQRDRQAAERAETNVLNALNDAPRRLDQSLADLKSQAPRRSDWHNSAQAVPVAQEPEAVE